MRPPICEICHQNIRDDISNKLVSFKKDAEDKEWYERAKTPGFVGHPPHLGWFCEKHIEFANAHAHLTLSEALRLYRQQHTL